MTACVNGKWLAQSPSGTQRYATEVMRAIASTPAASQITLVLPKDAVEPPWAASFPKVRSRFRGILFEQVALPWITRGRHLYSMCGPAPLVKRKQTLVMHDANTFRYPGSFRPAFVIWQRLLYIVLSRTAKRVLTVSAFSRAELATVLGVPRDRFELAPCAADHIDPQPVTDPVEPLPFEPRHYALIVGNLAPHKNVGAAVAALAQAGVPVAVVGGAQHVQHVFRGAQLEGRDNVRLVGRVDDRRLQELYAGAAVLVAPSRYEGFCIPIIEAGKLGCPTVFATGSAMTEVAGHGGLSFDPDDMSRCVELVEHIMSNPPLRERLSAKARTNAERFSWARTAEIIFARPATESAVDTDAPAGPIRVLHVTETFGSGIRTAIIGYAEAVRAQGVESWLLAQDRDCGLTEELDESSPFVATRMVPHGLLNLWRAIGSSVEELRPDVVHLHSSLAGGVGRLWFGLKGKPALMYTPNCFSFEMQDISPLKHWIYWVAECMLARRTDAFLCVSPHEAELARGLHSRAEVVLMLNMFGQPPTAAVDSAISSTVVDAAPRPIRIVNVGRVTAQKDPVMFAEIITALHDDDIAATWVGDGPESLRAVLETAGVAVTGWLPAREVGNALRGQTVYLHTSSWEGGPIALREAMDAGLPVVVRRNPAYEGYLPQQWQFDDVGEAVRMVRVLAEEPARSQRISEQFKVLVEHRKSGPDVVLAAAYRRHLKRSLPRDHADGIRLDAPATGHDGPDLEEARWTHRSFPS